jgi:hypothetical protein
LGSVNDEKTSFVRVTPGDRAAADFIEARAVSKPQVSRKTQKVSNVLIGFMSSGQKHFGRMTFCRL